MKSWVERTEEISTRIKQLTDTIIEQRCEVVTSPLAHHLAMAESDWSEMDESEFDKTLHRTVEEVLTEMNLEHLPLTESSRELRKSIALSAAVAIVKLLANEQFLSDVFRDNSGRFLKLISFCARFSEP